MSVASVTLCLLAINLRWLHLAPDFPPDYTVGSYQCFSVSIITLISESLPSKWFEVRTFSR